MMIVIDLALRYVRRPWGKTVVVTSSVAASRKHLKMTSMSSPVNSSPKYGHVGLSENRVPLHPMVLLIIIPTKWL